MAIGGKSDFLEAKVLDYVLSQASYTPPATTYVALFTTIPTDGSDASTGTEVSGGSYVRVAVTNNATNWPATTVGTGAKSNGTAINFVTATAPWGTVIAFGIYDASTSGNLLYYGLLSTAKTVGTGDTLGFATGSLTITES